jgi:hypothetical protein
MVRTADFSALTKGLFKGLLWGQIQLFCRKFTKLRGAQISQRAAIICPLLFIAVKSAVGLTPARRNIFRRVCDPPSVPISALANGFLPRTWRGRQTSCGQRSGPRAAFRTGWQQAPRMHTILLQFKSCVNVVRYKHVYYANVHELPLTCSGLKLYFPF